MGDMLDKAMILAIKAHKGQVDKGGNDYILHPIRVMTKLKTETERIVGVLHDVIEDTSISYEMLEGEGFSEEVIVALKHLTRGREESYLDFIKRAKSNDIARNVKLADLSDNMDITRIKNPTGKDIARVRKYQRATEILMRD